MMQSGQASANNKFDAVLKHVLQGRVKRDEIIQHRLFLTDVARALKLYKEQEEECVKEVTWSLKINLNMHHGEILSLTFFNKAASSSVVVKQSSNRQFLTIQLFFFQKNVFFQNHSDLIFTGVKLLFDRQNKLPMRGGERHPNCGYTLEYSRTENILRQTEERNIALKTRLEKIDERLARATRCRNANRELRDFLSRLK
jgi:hypothetical protein